MKKTWFALLALLLTLLFPLAALTEAVEQQNEIVTAPVDEAVREAAATQLAPEEIDDIEDDESVLNVGESEENAANIAINKANFPDAKFRNYVKKNIDTDGNGKLSKAERDRVEDIQVGYMEITSLKGLEYFTNLKNLGCHNNNLKKLDVSKNKSLVELACSCTALTSLDLTKNTNLKELYCEIDTLARLKLGKCKKLSRAILVGDNLKSVDISGCTKLKKLTKKSLQKIYAVTPGTEYYESSDDILAFNSQITIKADGKVLYAAEPKSVKLNKTKATVKIGKTLKLKATLVPDTVMDKLTWTSSNTKVAKVSKKGVVTPVKKGTAKITVKTANGKQKTCKVTVKAGNTKRTELKKYINKVTNVYSYYTRFGTTSDEEMNNDIRNAYEGVFGKLTTIQWDELNDKFDRIYLKGDYVQFYAFGSGGGYLLSANAPYSLLGFYAGMTMDEAKNNADSRSDVTRFISSYGADLYDGLAEAQAVTNVKLGWAKVSVVLLYNKSTKIIKRIGLEVFIGN